MPSVQGDAVASGRSPVRPDMDGQPNQLAGYESLC